MVDAVLVGVTHFELSCNMPKMLQMGVLAFQEGKTEEIYRRS